MKWLSVDIGIKNMAYCILTLENNEINVVDWNVINLIEPVKPTVYMCSCLNVVKSKGKPKSKSSTNTININTINALSKPCNKKAIYQKNQEYYCETHAKNHTEYCIPTKEHTLAFLRKKKVGEITELFTSIFPGTNSDELRSLEFPRTPSATRPEYFRTPPTKPDMIDAIFAHYTSKLFTVLPKPAKKNANDTDLVSIGWAIKREFDNMEHISGVTHVVIENQISPIATRMKTIQGMLAQYFIMRSNTLENTQIHFVSSSNKLKMCEPNTKPKNIKTTQVKPSQVNQTTETLSTEETKTNANANTKDKTSYRKNKQDGIQLCSRYLANNPSLTKWSGVLHTTKKDDLADCFLQGIWFMYNQKIITYAENLKINSV